MDSVLILKFRMHLVLLFVICSFLNLSHFSFSFKRTKVFVSIDGFHCDVKNCKVKIYNSEVLRILIYTRLKINKKQIFVQVSISVARFISKIQQFELPRFHTS